MKFLFHPEAETEFLAAIDWYEERTAGLGAVMHLRRHPDYWRERK